MYDKTTCNVASLYMYGTMADMCFIWA